MEQYRPHDENVESSQERQQINEKKIFQKLNTLETVVTKLSVAEKEKYEKLITAAAEVKKQLESETEIHKELLLWFLEEVINWFLVKLEGKISKQELTEESSLARKKRTQYEITELQQMAPDLFAMLVAIPKEEEAQKVVTMISEMPYIASVFSKVAPGDTAFQSTPSV